jgi:hypothetical protein
MNGLVRLAVVGVAISLVALCGACSAAHTDVPPELRGAPKWVLHGCDYKYSDAPAPICGVGSASGSKNKSMLRSMAIGRARNDPAQVIPGVEELTEFEQKALVARVIRHFKVLDLDADFQSKPMSP